MGIYTKIFLKKIAHFQVKNPLTTIFMLFFLTIIIWGGISKVETVASLELMMPKSISEISTFNDLRDTGLGQDMIAVVLRVDSNSLVYDSGNFVSSIDDVRVSNYIESLSSVLEKESGVLSISSYVGLPDSMKSDYISSDLRATYILINTDLATDDFRMNLLVNRISGILLDFDSLSGVSYELTGTPIVQQKLGSLINSDRASTQWISTLMVFTITALIFRSFLSAIVPIIVVFASVNWLYGTMGYTGLPISTLAGGVAAMVIGIGIDFAIHIINKFKFERKNGLSILDSVELAVVHTGSALGTTSLTTMAAFLAFMVGVMPEMGRFGILMAIGIFYSLVFSIFGLPALLVIEEKIIYYFKSKVNFGIEGELHLEENRVSKK
jgi:predicted RND superfamily exporter protein